jgi:hypothetical protein
VIFFRKPNKQHADDTQTVGQRSRQSSHEASSEPAFAPVPRKRIPWRAPEGERRLDVDEHGAQERRLQVAVSVSQFRSMQVQALQCEAPGDAPYPVAVQTVRQEKSLALMVAATRQGVNTDKRIQKIDGR